MGQADSPHDLSNLQSEITPLVSVLEIRLGEDKLGFQDCHYIFSCKVY